MKKNYLLNVGVVVAVVEIVVVAAAAAVAAVAVVTVGVLFPRALGQKDGASASKKRFVKISCSKYNLGFILRCIHKSFSLRRLRTSPIS